MNQRVTTAAAQPPRVLPEKANRMAPAVLRKAESDDAMKEVGECLDFARRAAGWTLKQLAAALHRDERQIQRWMEGKENTNIATVFGVEVLRAPFVIALARLAGSCEEETTLRFRRRA